MTKAAENRQEVIPVQVDLRSKARPRPGIRKGEDPVAAAEKAIANMSFQFKNWMGDEIEKVSGTWKTITDEGISPDLRDDLFRATHDIRGQAETLGYPLAGLVAGSLCILLEAVEDVADLPMQLMEKHIQSMCAIVNEKAEDENPVGQELVATLRELTDDHIARI